MKLFILASQPSNILPTTVPTTPGQSCCCSQPWPSGCISPAWIPYAEDGTLPAIALGGDGITPFYVKTFTIQIINYDKYPAWNGRSWPLEWYSPVSAGIYAPGFHISYLERCCGLPTPDPPTTIINSFAGTFCCEYYTIPSGPNAGDIYNNASCAPQVDLPGEDWLGRVQDQVYFYDTSIRPMPAPVQVIQNGTAKPFFVHMQFNWLCRFAFGGTQVIPSNLELVIF